MSLEVDVLWEHVGVMFLPAVAGDADGDILIPSEGGGDGNREEPLQHQCVSTLTAPPQPAGHWSTNTSSPQHDTFSHLRTRQASLMLTVASPERVQMFSTLRAGVMCILKAVSHQGQQTETKEQPGEK